MIKSIRARPFEVHIMETHSLLVPPGPPTLSPLGRVTGRGDGPRCSREQEQNYKENWEKILPPKVVRQIKRKGGVLHGSWSVNKQVGPQFSRRARDMDIWANEPKDRAEEMENEIDRHVGCDIMCVKEQIIPKGVGVMQKLGPPRKVSEKKHMRYNVEAPHDTGSADYSHFPDDAVRLQTTRVNGVQHETLEAAYQRSLNCRYQPLRATKALKDKKRIEKYWESQKGRRGNR